MDSEDIKLEESPLNDKVESSSKYDWGLFFINLIIFLVNSSVNVLLFILSMIYTRIGYKGLGELLLFIRFTVAMFGGLLFPYIIRNLNIKLAILIGGFSHSIIIVISCYTFFCTNHRNIFICFTSSVYIVNIIFVITSGLFGPTFVLGVTYYVEQISNSQNKNKNILSNVVARKSSFAFGLFMIVITTSFTNYNTLFIILSISCIIFVLILSLITSNLENMLSVDIKESFKEIFISLKNKFVFFIAFFSFYQGLNMSNFSVFLYRFILHILTLNHSKSKLLEQICLSSYGLTALIVIIIIFKFYKQHHLKRLFIIGMISSFFLIVCKFLCIFYDYKFLAILCYTFNGLSQAVLTCATLLYSVKEKDLILQTLSLARANVVLGISFGCLIGAIFLNYDGILIFNIIEIIIAIGVIYYWKKYIIQLI